MRSQCSASWRVQRQKNIAFNPYKDCYSTFNVSAVEYGNFVGLIYFLPEIILSNQSLAINYHICMTTTTSKSFSLLCFLVLFTLGATFAVERALLPLDKGELTLYRPWIGESQVHESHHSLPINQEQDQRIAIGIKNMEIQDPEHSGLMQKHGLQMWIQKDSGKRVSCILRQQQLGLINLGITYLKTNIKNYPFLQLQSGLNIDILASKSNPRHHQRSFLWNQEAEHQSNEGPWDLKLKLMISKFRGLVLLRGFTLPTQKHTQFELNIELAEMNVTHLTFQNFFRQIQSVTFDLLYFREIDIYQNMVSYTMETINLFNQNSYNHQEVQNDSKILSLLNFFQLKLRPSAKNNDLSIQTNKIAKLRFQRISCPKGYYWDIQGNECVSECPHNLLGKGQTCLQDKSKQAHLSQEAQELQYLNDYPADFTERTHPRLLHSCHFPDCEKSISHCSSCVQVKSDCSMYCKECADGYYLGYQGSTCVSCPSTCKTCTSYYYKQKTYVNCTSCVNNLTLTKPSPYTCACTASQYMVSNTCVNCPTGCAKCTSATNCLSSTQGYYLSGSTSLKCMPVCYTCIQATTCSSCSATGGLVLNSLGVCVCTSPQFLVPTSPPTCSLCSTLYTNCLSCSYSGAYSSSSPVPVVCSTPALGYFISGNGTAACGSYCTTCTSNTQCTVCIDPSFSLTTGVCSCPATTYLTNTTPLKCDSCSNIIAGCLTCSHTTSTLCSGCQPGFYPASTLPTTTCSACLFTCATCTNGTGCVTCNPGFSLNGSICDCNSGFIDVATQSCLACSAVVLNCATCLGTYPTTCQTCNSGYYSSAGGSQCLSCPLNCNTCSSTGVCLTCNTGFSLKSSNICDCGATCQACNATMGITYCVDCSGSYCFNTQAGYYANSGSVYQCPLACSSCSDATTCSDCNSPFILTSTSQCVCNSTNNVYLSLNGATCLTCAQIFSNCTVCSAGPTTCQNCVTGMFFDGTSCISCQYPCVSCSGSATNCITCQGLLIPDNLGACICDNSTLWYSNVTLNCITCPQLIDNCVTCQIRTGNPAYTDCTSCNDPYYADPITGTCLLCDSTCASCTATNCLICVNNLVASGFVCVPNTGSDPTLAFYAPTNSAVSCLNLLTSCTTCTPSPLACTNCSAGTFINGNACQSCASTCATCDINGCTSCPTGTALNGTACVCSGSCQTCQNSISNCLSCTLSDSTVTSCTSCEIGYYLSNGLCQTCATGCAVCTDYSTCTTCLPTFTLSSSSCSCNSSLNLYQNGLTCQLCTTVVYGCNICTTSADSTTVCAVCEDGFYLDSTGFCSPCSPSCATCSDPTLCSSCPTGYTLETNKTCACGPTCNTCNTSQLNCVSCTLTAMHTFGQCDSCAVGFYLDASYQCQQCPSSCTTCGALGVCLSCPASQQIISGVCMCNSVKGLVLNTANNLCESCSGTFSNCILCVANSTYANGYSCGSCQSGYQIVGSSCQLQFCGDGVVSSNQECDDGNTLPNDGCFQCKVQPNYACSGSPSLCSMNIDFRITFDSLVVSATSCNQLTINFAITPISPDYDSADFDLMLVSYQNVNATNKHQAKYQNGIVSYTFNYTSELQGAKAGFYFIPSLLNIPSTATIGLYPLFFTISGSDNSIPLKHYSQEQCSQKQFVASAVEKVQYASYGVLMASALPCKIVGLQLFGVLQLSFFTLGNIDNLNPLLASLTQLSASNGLNLKLDNKQKTKSRLLQQAALTPSRVQTIGYASNFLRNCNLMLFVVYGIMLAAFVLYLLSYLFKKCAPSLFSLCKRIFKQVLLTLILFNCFNFAYSSGLHFAYADHADQLYVWGTIAAITTIVIPLAMVLVLQCTEEDGFGEYKDKLKRGCLQRAYFMITIIYRMGIGYYTATMNEDDLSTLIVLALSLFFMLYNLVNLPFQKAYHNYRANICHITQFVCLFVGMYYRSMKSTSSVDDVNNIYSPVYIQLLGIAICLTASMVVLFYEIYVWIIELKNGCCKKSQNVENEGNSLTKLEKQDDSKEQHNITNADLALQSQEIEYQ